jgi:hypothetical protein
MRIGGQITRIGFKLDYDEAKVTARETSPPISVARAMTADDSTGTEEAG